MKKIILFTIFALALISCKESNSVPNEEKIWNDESIRIHITQDLGNVSGTRYNETEFTKQQLDENQLNILKSLILVDKNELSCIEDGVTYNVKIYQTNDQFKEYSSNNSACNDFGSKKFILTENIEKILIPPCKMTKK